MKEIEFPIEVNEIKSTNKMPFDCYCIDESNIGKLVKIRPCAEEYGDKTYLGLFLGDVHLGHHITYKHEEKVLNVYPGMGNPAIFVFALNKVIYGCGSWWGTIESEEELDRMITDESIENVWYVKLLKELAKGKDDGNTDASSNESSE